MRMNRRLLAWCFVVLVGSGTCAAAADRPARPWPGRHALWRGFDQWHFTVDGRACYVVVPREPARGKPWIWRARFPEYHAEADAALLEKGFHLAYLDVAGMFGAPTAVAHGDRFYERLVTRHGLSKRPVLEGVSRGGLFVYNWAIAHPDKVACIYADTPVLDFKSWPAGKGKGIGSETAWRECLDAYGLTEPEALQYQGNPIDNVDALIRAGVPMLHIVSLNDAVVPPEENTELLKQKVQQSGRVWLFSQMTVKEGTKPSHGHHFPHPDPGRVVRFIVQHAIFEGGYVATGGGRSLEEIEKIYASMPPLKYRPPGDRGKHLPRTMQRLREGGTLRVVMLGDSIINDTSRSQWQLLLERAAPNCEIMKWTAVRGSTGCWWYRHNHRVELYVLQQKPDLVIIGGISQRGDVESIGEVIRQIHAGCDAEMLLTSGTFGRVDPRDNKQWRYDIDPNGNDYRARLKRLADETATELLDMRGPWGRYIRQSGKDVKWFKRDPVHANERGEQIIGRILARYLTPPPSAGKNNDRSP